MPGRIWYPPADRDAQPRDGRAGSKNMTGVEMKFLSKLMLHSTETQGWPGYPSFAPTLTYDPVKHQWRQHMPLNRSATTLADPSSTGVRENRDDVVQVEIVGYCDPAMVKKYGHDVTKLDDQAIADLAELVAFLHAEWQLPLEAIPANLWVAYPGSYGARAKQRLTGVQYDAFRGVLGHQHASGNDHGDPGPLPIALIMAAARDLVDIPVQPTKPKPAPAADTRPPTPRRPDTTVVVAGGSIRTPFGAKGTNPATGRSWWAAGYHPGDDWHTGAGRGDLGKPVLSAVGGRVVYAGNGGGWGDAFGVQVIVEDGSGDRTLHGHMQVGSLKVRAGDWVDAGQPLGDLGQTGNVSGPHVHVERREAPFAYSDHVRPRYQTAAGYPGAAAFRLDQTHPAVTLLGRRLRAHGYAAASDGNGYQPGPRFTQFDRTNVRAFQEAQGWTGSDADGYPGPSTWKLLQDRVA